MLTENFLRLLQSRADGRCDKVFFCHNRTDFLTGVGNKAQIAVGENADQLAVLNNRNTRNLVLAHKFVRVRNGINGRKEKRVHNNAVFGTLYLIDFVNLLFNAHILVDNANAALTSNRNCHFGLRNGIHRRRHNRRVQLYLFCELSFYINHIRRNVALRGYKQNIVECQPLFNKFLVEIAV